MGYLFERGVTTKVPEKLFDVEVTKVFVKSLVVVHTVFRKCINQFEVDLCLELVLGHNTHAGFWRVACLVLIRRCFVFRKPVDKGVTWRWMSGFLEKTVDRVNCRCQQDRDIEASISFHNREEDLLVNVTFSVALVRFLVRIANGNRFEGLEEEWWFNPLWCEILIDDCRYQIQK